mmetsp:Transcript_44714/g.97357  ORF Transcript_44714/g.97357 Transcript_44714/m.97357 type:complete len:87 (-) Transcript_44714:305-565(-)|eukprot:3556578-Pleurochrysis_carterae.AAC.4
MYKRLGHAARCFWLHAMHQSGWALEQQCNSKHREERAKQNSSPPPYLFHGTLLLFSNSCFDRFSLSRKKLSTLLIAQHSKLISVRG